MQSQEYVCPDCNHGFLIKDADSSYRPWQDRKYNDWHFPVYRCSDCLHHYDNLLEREW